MPNRSRWPLRVVPMSSRITQLFALSVGTMLLHKVECYWAEEWLESPLFQTLVALGHRVDPDPDHVLGEAMFLVFVTWLFAGLFMGWLVLRGGGWAWTALAVWGGTFVLEWHHVVRAIARGGYYPGLITALVYLAVMAVYWRELSRLVQRVPADAAQQAGPDGLR